MLSKKEMIGIVIAAAIALFTVYSKASANDTDSVYASEATQQVHALTPTSLRLVDEAIVTLYQGWTNMDQAKKESFLKLYDPSATGEVDAQFVAHVLANYQEIRATLASDIPVAYAAESDTCEGKRLYYTDLTQLYVCPYFFQEENELRKARTLIHEMAHIALIVADRPYYRPTSRQYAELTPNGSSMTQLPLVGRIVREVLRSDTLYHPDAYAHFALINAGYTNIYAPRGQVRTQKLLSWKSGTAWRPSADQCPKQQRPPHQF